MALTFGFYDSINGDRTYNAEQFSRFFDGIISDGIIKAVGSKFQTTPGTNLAVKVGSGRAWFNHTWTYNDSDITVTLPAAHATLPRIDSIILSIDEQERTNTITYKQGTAASTPSAPAMTNTETLHEYRIANVAIAATVTSISSADITNIVGTNETPYATLSDMNVDYNTVANRPSINNVILTGNKTTAQLNISYNDLTNKPTYDSLSNKPSINNVTLTGNKTTTDLNISYNDLTNKPALKTVATSGSYTDLTNKPTLNGKSITGAIDWAPGALNSKNGVEVTHSVSLRDRTWVRVDGTVQIPAGVNGQSPRRIAIVGQELGAHMDYNENGPDSASYNQVKTDSKVGNYMGTAYVEITKCLGQTGKSSTDSGFVNTYIARSVAGYFDSNNKNTNMPYVHEHVQQYPIYTDSYNGDGVIGSEAEIFSISISTSRQRSYGPGMIAIYSWSGSDTAWKGQFGNVSWSGTTLRYSYYFDRNGSDWWFDGAQFVFRIYVLE